MTDVVVDLAPALDADPTRARCWYCGGSITDRRRDALVHRGLCDRRRRAHLAALRRERRR